MDWMIIYYNVLFFVPFYNYTVPIFYYAIRYIFSSFTKVLYCIFLNIFSLYSIFLSKHLLKIPILLNINQDIAL